MKIRTVREFRDNATVLLGSKEPILLTHGFCPLPQAMLPIELKRDLFSVLSDELQTPD